ncbi:MAG: sodium ion-translocating decarboxylase subunit beta [Burkholderiales bacterium]
MKQLRKVSKVEKIAFPIVIAIIVNLFFPPVAPLITMPMLGNLFKGVYGDQNGWRRPPPDRS